MDVTQTQTQGLHFPATDVPQRTRDQLKTELVRIIVDAQVHRIITMIKWIRTSRLSIQNELSLGRAGAGSRQGSANNVSPAPCR